jgi:hypothetical protein
MDRKKLVLHVPYVRLLKHALSKPFIDLLNEKFDITILAPFKISEADLVYLALNKKQFVKYSLNHKSIQRNICMLVDYFRRYSFFYRNSDKFRLISYLKILSGPAYPSILRWIANFMSLCRLDQLFWKWLDFFLWRFYTPSNIRNINLNCDIFIQYSNWGFNDFAIKNAKFLKNAKKFLFPYSTDQIFVTGYLLFDFKKIYCQSDKEQTFLKALHDYKGESGLAGSLWFRHIDFLLHSKEIKTRRKSNSIVYAGLHSEFFPKCSEVQFVNNLQKQFPHYEIVYLPYFFNDENKNELVNVHENIKIEFFENTITEISANNLVNFKSDIVRYIEKLIGANLFVMSFNTSMGLDFAYLNRKKIFAYFKDDQGKVAAGSYIDVERMFFFEPHYQEITGSYKFTSSDFEIVDSPASNNWDAKIELSSIVQELYKYAQKI